MPLCGRRAWQAIVRELTFHYKERMDQTDAAIEWSVYSSIEIKPREDKNDETRIRNTVLAGLLALLMAAGSASATITVTM